MTHTKNFVKGVVGLFGNEGAFGEALHITSEKPVQSIDVLNYSAKALGVDMKCVDVPRAMIYREMPEYREVVEGDKGRTMIFDDSKIKAIVPGFSCLVSLRDEIADMVDFYNEHSELKIIDWEWMGKLDHLFKGIGDVDPKKVYGGGYSQGLNSVLSWISSKSKEDCSYSSRGLKKMMQYR